jgi:hypothetical protein
MKCCGLKGWLGEKHGRNPRKKIKRADPCPNHRRIGTEHNLAMRQTRKIHRETPLQTLRKLRQTRRLRQGHNAQLKHNRREKRRMPRCPAKAREKKHREDNADLTSLLLYFILIRKPEKTK